MEKYPFRNLDLDPMQAAWQHEALTADDVLRMPRFEALGQLAVIPEIDTITAETPASRKAGELAVVGVMRRGTFGIDATLADFFSKHGARENGVVSQSLARQTGEYALAA